MTRVLGLGNGLIGTNINLNPLLFVDIAWLNIVKLNILKVLGMVTVL